VRLAPQSPLIYFFIFSPIGKLHNLSRKVSSDNIPVIVSATTLRSLAQCISRPPVIQPERLHHRQIEGDMCDRNSNPRRCKREKGCGPEISVHRCCRLSQGSVQSRIDERSDDDDGVTLELQPSTSHCDQREKK